MNELVSLGLALATGILLGAIFFGGLWWTAQQLVSSRQPALWVFGSMMLRTSIVLVGFYVIAHGYWQRMLACMLGFVLARLIVIRLTRAAETPAYSDHEANHAS